MCSPRNSRYRIIRQIAWVGVLLLMKLTLLFWNLRENSSTRMLSAIASVVVNGIPQFPGSISPADIVVLAEVKLSSLDIIRELKTSTGYDYEEALPDPCNKIRIFTKFSRNHCRSVPGASDDRYTVRCIDLPNRVEFLLVGAHLPDKRNNTVFVREKVCQELAGNILIAERTRRHQNTIIIGDLNGNPYETPITGSLKAVITRALANKARNLVNKEYEAFFNPMWQHFGETNGSPAGTFYWSGTIDEHYWQILDQVLIRPGLLNRFKDKDLMILTSCPAMSLLTKQGIPRKKATSDHLPIICQLDV